MMEKNNMNIKKMVAPIVAIMMVAAIFVTLAAAFTAPNANDDRVEFEYSQGDCDGLYVNERMCGDLSVPTLRIYGEDSHDAAFPYTTAEAPFDPRSTQAPEKDFVIGNPAYITEDTYGNGDLIQVDGADGREKIFIKQWYVPAYKEPRGLVWVDQNTVYSADIVTEYSYMLLDSHNLPTAAKHANFWFPIGSRDDQIGLDSFDLTTGSWDVDDPTMVALNDVGDYNGDGRKDITIETRDPVRLYDDGQWIEFLDHRIYVKDVAQVAGGAWAATVDVYYIGNRNQQLIQSNVDVVVGDTKAFGRHSYHPAYDLCFERPWYITAESHTQEFVNGTSVHSVKVRVGRRLHTKETFFVDGAEYDVAMIYGPAADEFKYITIRNPTPKIHDVTLDALSVTKKCVPACEVLPVLPPFNFNGHVMIDDINLPDCYTDCSNEPCDIVQDDTMDILNTQAGRVHTVDALKIMWVQEKIEPRFHTSLLEILNEPEETWQWIHIHIMPDAYTEMCYPELPDAKVCLPWCKPCAHPPGDFLLVSSWEAPNSCGDRMKFAYDAEDVNGLPPLDIYVNEPADDGTTNDRCGTNSVRVYGEGDKDAAFPYTDPEGPFNKLSADAHRKDFVTFNPAFISEDEYGVDDQIVVNSYDGAEKVFVRQWYVPEYKEPKGLTWVPQDPEYTADIVTEYSYMLLYASSNLPAPCTPVGTNFWFPIGSKDGQIGLDSFDLTTDDWIIPVEDPTMVALKDVSDYNGDGRKDITIETRDAVRLFDTGLNQPDEWIEFLDHRIYVKDVSQVAGGEWAATVDVYYIGNDAESLVQSDVDVVVGDTKAFGRHSYHPDYDLCFERPWYITAVSHTVELVGSTSVDSVKVRVGRRLHTKETFFVDGAEYDVAMIYGPEADEFKYITIRNPTPKHTDVTLDDLSIVKTSVSECDVLPMLPPFNMNHSIVDDIGIPHYCPKDGNNLIYGDYLQDEPTGIPTCADTVKERILPKIGSNDPLEPPFVSYFYKETNEPRFRTNLLEILDEDTTESWDMLCMWTLPDRYTAMVYPCPNKCACCNRDADFLVTTSGPKGNVTTSDCNPWDDDGTITVSEIMAAITLWSASTPPADGCDLLTVSDIMAMITTWSAQ